jgi:hypothetical protein
MHPAAVAAINAFRQKIKSNGALEMVMVSFSNAARLVTTAALAGGLAAGAALAHHGWSWTTGKNIELAGVIKTSKLGNPHGVLTLDVKGVVWTVEVGQPWRNKRAGLKDSDLAVGKEIGLSGEPAANAKQVIKAERIFIKGKTYNLYPDRK